MARIVNPNLTHLVHSFNNGYRGAILEGSSRSAKTWSSVDFIVWLCSKVEHKATINIIKETYNSFKTTLYDDFNRRLPDYGIRSPFADRQEVKQFKLFGNKINLLGADSDTIFHGVGSDYVYFNELLDISQSIWDQSEMRCRKFLWGDYNPKATDHWVYDKICLRPNIAFLKTTFLDNPYLSINEREKILSYEPTHPLDRDKPSDKRRPHPVNIINGTADDYMWNVYGLGLRSAPEGVVFQHVTWINAFPKNIEKVYYGNDFGFTNDPTAICRLGVDGPNVYLQKLFYEPTPSSNEYLPMLSRLPKGVNVLADGAGKGLQMIRDARAAGYRVLAVTKTPGDIQRGISLLKKYKIHIVDSPEWRKEQSNYKFREINGIRIDEPVDAFNHLWDAARYAALSNLRG